MILYLGSKNLGVAQFGSALPWGGRGRGFKSRHSDQRFDRKQCLFSAFGHFLSCLLFGVRDIAHSQAQSAHHDLAQSGCAAVLPICVFAAATIAFA